MAVNLGLWAYIKAAFTARFLGMFVSPAWLIIAAFGFLGALVDPGFFLIGAGVEFAYLFTIASHPRFQRIIQYRIQSELNVIEKAQWQERINKLILQLAEDDKKRFYNLENRCDSILDFYSTQLSLNAQLLEHHSQSLNKLLWIFLQLLVTKQAVVNLTQGTLYLKNRKSLEAKIQELEEQLNKPDIAAELKKSFESKRDIIKMRLQTLIEAEQKMTYITAEIDRIEQQVELIREQALISKDSQGMANRIDMVSSSLSQTSEWIKQQEGFLGSMEDFGETSPSILSRRQKSKEAQ
jgi:hypothetical protein